MGLVKGRFSLPDDEWKTKEEKTDFQTVKLSAEFMAIPNSSAKISINKSRISSSNFVEPVVTAISTNLLSAYCFSVDVSVLTLEF